MDDIENEECCGEHAICEHDTLLNTSNTIEYFDDEELDVLADISPAQMTREQVNQLFNVFYVLQEREVAPWLRSLQMRRIQLPIELREQALFVISERRMS